jgi:hypothetical protein
MQQPGGWSWRDHLYPYLVSERVLTYCFTLDLVFMFWCIGVLLLLCSRSSHQSPPMRPGRWVGCVGRGPFHDAASSCPSRAPIDVSGPRISTRSLLFTSPSPAVTSKWLICSDMPARHHKQLSRRRGPFRSHSEEDVNTRAWLARRQPSCLGQIL